jgi:hypothetical protein
VYSRMNLAFGQSSLRVKHTCRKPVSQAVM